MNNWLKGLLISVGFFIVVGVVGNLSSDPFSSGEKGAKLFLPLVVIVVGFYSGYKVFKRKESHKR